MGPIVRSIAALTASIFQILRIFPCVPPQPPPATCHRFIAQTETWPLKQRFKGRTANRNRPISSWGTANSFSPAQQPHRIRSCPPWVEQMLLALDLCGDYRSSMGGVSISPSPTGPHLPEPQKLRGGRSKSIHRDMKGGAYRPSCLLAQSPQLKEVESIPQEGCLPPMILRKSDSFQGVSSTRFSLRRILRASADRS